MKAISFLGSRMPIILLALLSAALLGSGCSMTPKHPSVPSMALDQGPEYVIGPGDSVNIFVWRHPELSSSVPVRPDGKITTPLVEDVPATGKTPTQLARDMEEILGTYVRDPIVTVFVSGFRGPFDQQIRIIGQATNPQAINYSEHMTLLDVMIAVGGLTDFAAGNRTVIIREVDGQPQQFTARLDDLVKRGDISANAPVYPGDIMIVPESWF